MPSPPASPHDSVPAGGEVGNISLQTATGATSASPLRGVPQEGYVERTEHAAEADFMGLVSWVAVRW